MAKKLKTERCTKKKNYEVKFGVKKHLTLLENIK